MNYAPNELRKKYKSGEISLTDIEQHLLESYDEYGEEMVIWKDGILKLKISDFTTPKLIDYMQFISPNFELNKVFFSILEDVLLKRRVNKINKIKQNINGIIK